MARPSAASPGAPPSAAPDPLMMNARATTPRRCRLSAMPGLIQRLVGPPISPETLAALKATSAVNSAGYDPWGLNPEYAAEATRYFSFLYRHWLRVETHGLENVPQGRVMLVPNHGGQLPLDGMMVGLAMALEASPPRVVRGMVERWFPSLPFVSTLFVRCGQVVGDPENCEALLRREQCIMVFPEGVRGSGKLWSERYRLQEFGSGFVRIALETRTPIVPVAIIGCEETYPAIYNAKTLAKLMDAPYLPVTPTWPLLGPLGALPLPVKVQLYFGKPILFSGDPDEPDEKTHARVEQVKSTLQGMIDEGLRARPRLKALDRLARWGRP